MKRIKLFIMGLLTAASIGLTATPVMVYAANPKADVCNAIGGGNDCSKQPANGVSINSVITVVLNLLSAIIGVVAVIMIMLSGFKYVTSGGDASKTANAKNTLMYAIVGLVVVALSQAIVKFVLAKVK